MRRIRDIKTEAHASVTRHGVTGLIVYRFLCGAFIAADVASGQSAPVRVSSTQTCARCRIELDRIAVLGASTDRALPARIVHVSQTSRGEIVVGPSSERTQFLVYDEKGRLVRVVGRRGDGPGEYRDIKSVVVGRGDTVYVVDRGSGRITVLAPDYSLVRTVSFPAAASTHSLIPTARGDFVVQADIRTPELVGLPIHIVDRDGGILRSLGNARPTLRVGEGFQASGRHVALAADGSVWAARIPEYSVALWSRSGQQVAELERDAAWFPRRAPGTPARIDMVRPEPTLNGIRLDDEGRLWAVSTLADARWKATAPRMPSGKEGGVVDLGDIDRYVDTVIEVIDPRAGKLVAQRRFDQAIGGFTNGGNLLMSFRERPDGVVAIEVWRPRLVRD
jgi:hypothetical protein